MKISIRSTFLFPVLHTPSLVADRHKANFKGSLGRLSGFFQADLENKAGELISCCKNQYLVLMYSKINVLEMTS